MVMTKREKVAKQGFCKILWRRLRPRGSLLLEFIHSSGWGGVSAYLSLIGRSRGWALINFSAFRMGAYPRWGLIRGWALIRINTVSIFLWVCFWLPDFPHFCSKFEFLDWAWSFMKSFQSGNARTNQSDRLVLSFQLLTPQNPAI